MPYLYHRVPNHMIGTTLYPLNELKTTHPDIYASEYAKYEGRLHIPKQRIALLDNCLWNDVIFMSAVQPQELFDARKSAGFTKPLTNIIFQIDPSMLDQSKLAVYLFRPDREYEDNFAPYRKEDLPQYSIIPNETRVYFKEVYDSGAQFIPLFWRYVPHIIYKGSIDISDTPIVSVS